MVMKKIIATSVALVASLMVNAQNLKESEVPQPVKESFKNTFKEAKDVKWEKEKNGDFEVEFEINKTEQSATFDATGRLLETELEIATSEFPAEAKNYIIKTYPGSKIKKAEKITDAQGVITYEAEVSDLDVLFDSNGKFLKSVKD
jgi:hypothetical protein